ncbi:MAG: DUF4173 domain-containing protein [Paracoccaceae bacterium]
MNDTTIESLPYSLMTDGWWLDPAEESPREPPCPPSMPPTPTGSRSRRTLLPILASFVAIADVLFWLHSPGISAALFAVALMATLTVISRANNRALTIKRAVPISLLSALPATEHFQLLSFAFLLSGILAATGLALLPRTARLSELRPAVVATLRRLAWFSAWSLFTATRDLVSSQDRRLFVRHARSDWGMPLVGAGLFVSLFLSANPILQDWFDTSTSFRWLSAEQIARLIFWCAMAYLIWPLLCSSFLPAPILSRYVQARPFQLVGLNQRSVSNSLLLFNVIFAVQSGLDATYLWSGAALPDGLTYAEYAHRGAYPLVLTALLAGAYTLASRPFTEGFSRLQALLLIFVTQNVALVVSSIYRLDLYVDTYGLTYLRLHAAIWMAMVAFGLALILWQIARHHSNGWLLTRVGLLSLSVLYGSCFVNFADIVARANLGTFVHGRTAMIDFDYLCDLGPTAAPALRDFHNATGIMPSTCQLILSGPEITDWREWGFRSWRVQRYLTQHPMSQFAR